jgi:CubicO group peptidase (beta-lactamase class C family)
MKKIIIVLVLISSFFFVFSQENKTDYSDAFKIIEVWLEAQKDFDKLPGISAIIVDDQDVIWSGAYGFANPEKEVKTKSSTIYSICSISKLFTSVAIMKLYDEGKLRLDDEIGDLLPWYDLKQAYPESGPITVRSIMTHSAGLPREAKYPYWTAPEFDFPCREEIKEKLSDQKTLYPASTYFQYSNLGLSLLGEIVEEVSGVPFDEYIEKNILKPLKMKDTRTVLPEKKYGKELAVGYGMVNRKGERGKVNIFQAEGIKPAAGFSSNVKDLAKLASWQFRLRDSKEAEILKPATLKNMHNVHWMDPDFDLTWGLGFYVYQRGGQKWAGHNGSCPGYKSTLQLNLENKMAYSVMINCNGTSPWNFAHRINEIIKEAHGESNDSDIKLSDYVGNYSEQPWYAEIYMGTWYGKLVCFDLPTDDPVDDMTFLKYIEGDTFRRIRDNDELGEYITFERDEKGEVYRYKWFQNYSKKIIR